MQLVKNDNETAVTHSYSKMNAAAVSPYNWWAAYCLKKAKVYYAVAFIS